jgi:hypothetical protein
LRIGGSVPRTQNNFRRHRMFTYGKVGMLCKVLMIVLSFFILEIKATNPHEHVVSFDNLFVSSPYKQVLDACMGLCGDLDVWHDLLSASRSPDMQDTVSYAQVFAGKMLFIQQSLSTMIAQQQYISLEDLKYILTVIEGIERESAFLKIALSQEHQGIIENIFTTMKHAVEHRLAVLF